MAQRPANIPPVNRRNLAIEVSMTMATQFTKRYLSYLSLYPWILDELAWYLMMSSCVRWCSSRCYCFFFAFLAHPLQQLRCYYRSNSVDQVFLISQHPWLSMYSSSSTGIKCCLLGTVVKCMLFSDTGYIATLVLTRTSNLLWKYSISCVVPFKCLTCDFSLILKQRWSISSWYNWIWKVQQPESSLSFDWITVCSVQ